MLCTLLAGFRESPYLVLLVYRRALPFAALEGYFLVADLVGKVVPLERCPEAS